MAKTFDVIVIGAGPGGYVAAIRAAQLGMEVAVVEKRSSLGGTCLNVGCIPSKALLDSSEHYHQTVHGLKVHGIEVGEVKLNFDQMMKRKEDVVSQTVQGINYLFKKNEITRFEGTARFEDAYNLVIENGEKTEKIGADHIIIATGSEPTELPFAKFDEKRILSSTGALSLKKVPKKMIVIGGGYIGLEMGSVFARLGTDVQVVEVLDTITPVMDRELSKTLEKSLKKLGFTFHLKTKVTEVKAQSRNAKVTVENAKGESSSMTADVVLVAVGRRPYTAGLDLEKAGIELDDRGFVKVDDEYRTTAESVFAIGDVIQRGPMLAHKAEDEGVAVAELIDGQQPEINYDAIPGVIFTWPEVASVGQTEEQLKEDDVAYRVGKFPFKASGRARAAEEVEGFVKVLAAEEDDRILGVHMIGARCADLIAEAVVAMEFYATAEDIGRICHAHPTFAEPIKEAALMATADRALHI